ncbi:hypothetical protein HOY80DRAFT_1061902 [Tuber brumale]|nr:hypothetical protein HOY80DRAFT_1061902 [Tuber brumale]
MPYLVPKNTLPYLTAQGLANAVGEYLNSRCAALIVEAGLEEMQREIEVDNESQIEDFEGGRSSQGEQGSNTSSHEEYDEGLAAKPTISLASVRTHRVRVRTARTWLKKMGFLYQGVQKGVYLDGHEGEDVVAHRNKVFLLQWARYKPRMVEFELDRSWRIPTSLPLGEKPLVFITHDESTFNANDGKSLEAKDKGERNNGFRVSDTRRMLAGSGYNFKFLTHGGSDVAYAKWPANTGCNGVS